MIYVHMASSLNKQAFVAGLLWLKGETDAQNIQNTDAVRLILTLVEQLLSG